MISQVDFQSMSQKELHDCVLSHREDQQAFHACIDKLYAEGNWIDMPLRSIKGDRKPGRRRHFTHQSIYCSKPVALLMNDRLSKAIRGCLKSGNLHY